MSALDALDGRGDCFPTAAQLALYPPADVAAALAEIVVAHGRPVHRLLGERYWHAWVELRLVGGGGWLCLDAANDKSVLVKRPTYYRAGRIEPDSVLRFTPAEALAEMERRGHWGPWSDDWQPAVDL